LKDEVQTYEKRSMRVVAVFIALLMAVPMTAQERVPCRVRFSDKGPDSFAPDSDLYQRTLATYHPRALERRMSVGFDPLLKDDDKPLYAPYQQAVLAVSDSLLSELVWMNAIIVGLDTLEQKQVAGLPFVASVVPTSSVSYAQLRDIDCSPSLYGPSGQQLSVLQLQQLHDAGLYGQGARIGIIDNGFRWRDMSTLRHADVEREYDFIFRDSLTANDELDVNAQDVHGSLIFSVVGGWSHDSITGVAPFATYLLAKSEDMRYERRIEEELFVEALYWLERNGADISSSSLGYLTFDSTDASTPYELLDGKTTFAARAINLAAQRGMLCVTAAGNYGRPSSLITPADADSAITVGAMAVGADTLWAFSSKGPTADGRQKPEITAQGMAVYCQAPAGNIVRSSGTSLATPMVAGQLGLLRSLYPDVPLYRLRDALFANSMFPSNRDENMGHGVANTLAAAKYLGPGIGRPNIVIVTPHTAMFIPVFCMNPVAVEVLTVNMATGQRQTIAAQPVEGVWWFMEFPDEMFIGGDTLQVRVNATDSSTNRVRSYPGDFASFTVVRGHVDLACAVRLPSSITSVAQDASSTTVQIVGLPLEHGTTLITCLVPAELRVVDAHITGIDGSELPASIQQDQGRLIVNPTRALYAGVYGLSIRSASGQITIPFVVL
jgi:subtilisin family serine protease